MRQILHDRARRRKAAKRGGGDARRVPLEHIETPTGGARIDLLALDEALDKLTELAPRQARIIELRFFGGLTIEQTAEVLGLIRG